ncbi:MAG: hypothetical protein Q4A16_02120 [Lautropia sp.]|nr:hypothetical protein [Lautropia sp.]
MKATRQLQVAAATLLLLTGCAGEGGSNRAVANSPQPSTGDTTTPGSSSDTTLPGTPLPSPGPAPAPRPTPVDSNAPLISSQGVRGDVVLTMMDQQPCAPFPVPTSNYDGGTIDQQTTGVIDVFMNADLSPGNYVADTGFVGTPAPGQNCQGKTYQPARVGTYTYNVNSTPWYHDKIGSPWLKRGFNWVDMRATLTIEATKVSLGTTVQVDSTRDTTPYPAAIQQSMTPSVESMAMKATSPLEFELGGVVGYGVLKQWYVEGNTTALTQILLTRSNSADEAKLCWNTDLQYTKRLQCAVWKVPADWSRGKELTLIDHYLVEDRAYYPNDRGYLYWRTHP